MPSNSENHRLLIVDDDIRICRLLARILMQEGYVVEAVENGRAMWRALRTKTFDLIILDLRLPGEDGLSLARRLRAESDVPLIMLTGRDEQIDKVVGLEIGADDYVTKPFDRHELIARIRSILRRSGLRSGTANGSNRVKSVLKFEGWTLDLGRRQLTAPGGEKIELTSFEFQLLSVLVQKPGRLLSRDQILELVASRHWNPSDRSIDVHVAKLRRKLHDDPRRPGLIKTVRGIGYMFASPDDVPSDPPTPIAHCNAVEIFSRSAEGQGLPRAAARRSS
jgi:two-component system, OmpR family, response regulator